MNNTALSLSALFLTAALGCAASTHPAQPSTLGVARPASALLAVIDQPGPVELTTVASADWVVPLEGLINLEHEKAKAAGLEDRPEPIQIFFHVLKHPSAGTFLVDTGVQKALKYDPDRSIIRGLVAAAMHRDEVKVSAALGDWLAEQQVKLSGVMLTHLHLDHVLGLPDVEKGVPIYIGPNEVDETKFMNVFTQGPIDEALDGHAALSSWQFQADADGRFEGVIDVFGDGSVWAIWVPGHTPGSTAYLVRTTKGPVLLAGDACHTAWGWDHGVEPGKFSTDQAASKRELDKLLALVAEHPAIEVRLGHQAHGSPAVAAIPER
jgi:glyoxylase-like metal-dependent hydrolase (beta-lactamase superfamily II)